MLKKLLPFVLFGVSFGATAQTNFRPGYVLPLSGDTLRGEVDSRGAQRNARQARFRPSPEATITNYQPRQLRGYGFVGDRVYQTETVLLADSVQRTGQSYAPADTLPRSSFLEVVVRGDLSLLYLRDERGNDHYYVQPQSQPVKELVQKITLTNTNGVTLRKKSDDYRRTLAAATQSCLPLQPAITNVNLDLNSVARIVRRYNECQGSVFAEPARATRKNHVWLSAVVGAEKSQLVLNDNYAAVTAKGSSPIRPVVGLGANLRMAGVSKTISARLEALYESQLYESMKTNRNSQQKTQIGGSSRNEYRAYLSGIRMPLLVRYTYPRGKLRPIAYAGYGFNILLRNRNEVRNDYTLGGAPRTSNWHQWLIYVPRTLEQGIIGGLGLTTARPNGRTTSVELRYERSDGFSDSPSYGSRVNRFYVLLSYDLTK